MERELARDPEAAKEAKAPYEAGERRREQALVDERPKHARKYTSHAISDARPPPLECRGTHQSF